MHSVCSSSYPFKPPNAAQYNSSASALSLALLEASCLSFSLIADNVPFQLSPPHLTEPFLGFARPRALWPGTESYWTVEATLPPGRTRSWATSHVSFTPTNITGSSSSSSLDVASRPFSKYLPLAACFAGCAIFYLVTAGLLSHRAQSSLPTLNRCSFSRRAVANTYKGACSSLITEACVKPTFLA